MAGYGQFDSPQTVTIGIVPEAFVAQIEFFVDGIVLPHHPFDPTAPAISKHSPLITGWNEDEYTFFAWERGDTSAFDLDLTGLQAMLEPQFGVDTQQVMATYRRAMPNASATELYVAVSSIAMMGLGSVEIAEKCALTRIAK